MSGLGDLVANLTVNTKGWTSGLTSAKSMLGGMVGSVTSGLGQIGLAMNGLSAIGSIGSSLGSFVSLAANAEQVGVSFQVMLGSGEAATKMLADIKDFASTTPFNSAGLQQNAQELMNFGISAANMMPALQTLGDVAAGDQQKMNGLVTAFGQMASTGRLMGGELNQFINAGFNPLQEISKSTGEAMADLKKKMEAGAISAQMVAESFTRATSEGGQFYQMTALQGGTLTGMFGQLQDGVEQAMTGIGAALIQGFDLKGLLGQFSGFVDTFRSTWMPGITAAIQPIGEGFQKIAGPVLGAVGAGIGAVGKLASTAAEMVGSTLGVSFDDVVNNIVWFADTAKFAFENFDTLTAIGIENIKLFATNTLSYFSNMFKNAGTLLTWFGDNWKDIFFTAFDYVSTIGMNLGQNLRNMWQGVLDFVQGKGFKVDFKPLTEGFRSTIKKMPEFTQAAVAQTTPTLEALYAQLAASQAGSLDTAVDKMAESARTALNLGAEPASTGPANDTAKQGNTLALQGSSEAFKSIYANMNRPKGKDHQERIAASVDRQISLQEDMKESLRRMAGEPFVVFGGTV